MKHLQLIWRKRFSWIVCALSFVFFDCQRSSGLKPEYHRAVAVMLQKVKSRDAAAWREIGLEGCEYVYVTISGDGKLSIIFVEWRGKGSNMRGVLFSEAAFLAGDSVELMTYSALPPPDMPQVKEVITNVSIDRVISPNWYHVSRSID